MRKRFISSMGVALAAACIASGATAAEPAQAAATEQGAEAVQPVSYHGVQVFVDSKGKLRQPTAAERAALSNLLIQQRKSAVRLPGSRPLNAAEAATTLKRNKKGQVGAMMRLPQSKVGFMTAQRNADGTFSVREEQGQEPAATTQEVTP